MKKNFIVKRAWIFKKLSNYTFDEYESSTNKRCRHKTTGIFFSYNELARILKLSVPQTRRLIQEYTKIETREDRIKFVSHKNMSNQHSRKYEVEYDKILLRNYQEFIKQLIVTMAWLCHIH